MTVNGINQLAAVAGVAEPLVVYEGGIRKNHIADERGSIIAIPCQTMPDQFNRLGRPR